jgi:hypothetical protein
MLCCRNCSTNTQVFCSTACLANSKTIALSLQCTLLHSNEKCGHPSSILSLRRSSALVAPHLTCLETISSAASAPGHKTTLHNKMRDTLLCMFRTLGPLTGWTNHDHDAACEPTQLLSLCPGHCPADVGITLQPQASPAHTQPHTCPAIDVTITPPPDLPLSTSTVNPCNPHAAQAQKVVGKVHATNFMAEGMAQ